jgi:WhiB family redox-sensing transcriptional regulator
MTAATRLPTTEATATAPNWRARAACRAADPDLFWPEKGTPPEQIDEAKRICNNCPVKQACLDEAFRTNEWEAIAGGCTGAEREALLNPSKATNRFHARRLDNADARKLAVQFGAQILVCLVKRKMSVQAVADRFSATPRAVYGAFRILVPAPLGLARPKQPSSVERLLAQSKESMKTLERMGRSHSEIATVLGSSQSVVSASLAVLRQRDDAMALIYRNSRQVSLERCWAEETRIRRQAGVGLTVDDVIDLAGTRILELHQSGMTLRAVALKLGFNRESVRKAHQRITSKKPVRVLTKNEMGEAA